MLAKMNQRRLDRATAQAELATGLGSLARSRAAFFE
jgi:hypothetical protein